MLKRVLLALTFVAALGAAGVGITSKAEARHDCDYGYGGYGYRDYYPSYYSSYGYGPRFSYHRSYYPDFHRHHYRGHRHGHHHHGHHRGHSGVYFSIGF